MPGQRLLLSCVPGTHAVVAAVTRPTRRRPLPPIRPDHQREQSARRVNAIADDYWAAWVKTFPLALSSPAPRRAQRSDRGQSIAATCMGAREDQWLDQLQQVRASDLKETPEDAT